MTPLLEARGLTLEGRLGPVDVSIPEGELVAIIGPNGGGKTSLLKSLAGIERADGQVCIDSRPIEALGPSRRSYVFTFLPASRDLVWPIAARDVIALGLPKPDPHRIDALIDLLELQSLAHRPVDRLSTGERARVLLARALAPKPRLLLLDEPLSNLDPYWVLRLTEILRDTVASGTSAVVSLHDIDRLPAFDRALLIADGKVQADLPPGAMLDSKELAHAFRISRSPAGWTISSTEDPQSSR